MPGKSIPPLYSEASLFSRSRDVNQRLALLTAWCLPRHTLEIDYLSVYARDTADLEDLTSEANRSGERIGYKNGPVQRMNGFLGSLYPAEIIRVRQPEAVNLLGCADFIPTDHYTEIKKSVARVGAQAEEFHKQINGIPYSIVEVISPELQVAAYFPSIRLTPLIVAQAAVHRV